MGWSNEEEQMMTEVNRNTSTDGGGGGGGGGGALKWENLVSKMALRVLLVEADDSTRQIIAALLRKCNYRVVAVADGLKAWELLKGKPRNIDLILTEVDLPSISGFALLTLITEHDICKSIPVIMMSTKDSIGTVYKCMLRGAADYLVKPIRRNELRNLWQHVWRRRSLSFGGNGPQDEAMAENNAASNNSSGSRNKDYNEKGSDAQSSCTKPGMETESVSVEIMQSLPTWGKSSRNDEANTATSEPKIQRRNVCIANGACDVFNSSKTTMDLMGASRNHVSSNNGTDKFDFSPSLDLSLRRSHPNVVEYDVTEDRCTLRQSDSSAFTRYVHRPMQARYTTLVSSDCDQRKESEKNYSHAVTGYKSDAPGPMISTRTVVSVATGRPNQSEVATSCPQQRGLPVPVKGVRFNNGYGSVLPIICSQPGPSATPGPSSASQPEPTFRIRQNNFENAEQMRDQFGQITNSMTYQSNQKQDHIADDQGHVSPTTDQSTSGSFCNGGVSRLNSMGYGSNGNAVAENKTEEGYFSPNGNCHQSIHRVAALNKFRMKRKDRCFEKKVRYESRKKLAEQRPRVKGQFVRQVENDNTCGSSFDS